MACSIPPHGIGDDEGEGEEEEMKPLNAEIEYGAFKLPEKARRAPYGTYTTEIERFLGQERPMGKLAFPNERAAKVAANGLVCARKRWAFPVVVKRDGCLVYLIRREG
jgi:hypothetical protein